MKRVALLGWPLGHSLSPAMHNAAFAATGLDWRYEARPTEPGRLREAVDRIRGDDYVGANVTVPHKESIVLLLDGLTAVARQVGAVNTLVKEAGRLVGHNTDVDGLRLDLQSYRVDMSGLPALILGAGGAARAAVAACCGEGAHIRVVARRPEQAEALASLAAIEVFDWTTPGLRAASQDCGLIVNATPLGMSPEVEASPWLDEVGFPPRAFVYDLVYNPRETRLVRQARGAGLRAATGLGMLVEQGALAFESWTGSGAPKEIMRRAVGC